MFPSMFAAHDVGQGLPCVSSLPQGQLSDSEQCVGVVVLLRVHDDVDVNDKGSEGVETDPSTELALLQPLEVDVVQGVAAYATAGNNFVVPMHFCDQGQEHLLVG